MSDFISDVLAAIEAREQKARKAAPGPWRPNAEHDEVYAVDDIPVCEGFALSNNQLRATVDFIVDNDPSSVLRRCAVDRKLLRVHEHKAPYPKVAPGEVGCTTCHFDQDGDLAMLGWCDTIRLIAEVYSISVDTNEE
jgi:hypothetical protein